MTGTAATNCWDTCPCWPIHVSPSLVRKSDWHLWAPPRKKSPSWPLYKFNSKHDWNRFYLLSISVLLFHGGIWSVQGERRIKSLRYNQTKCVAVSKIKNVRPNLLTGAGLLSSIAELRHALSEEAKPKIKEFNPDVTCREECIITSFQNAYFYSQSFEEAKEKMRYSTTLLLKSIFIILDSPTGNLPLQSTDRLAFGTIPTLSPWRCSAPQKRLPESCQNSAETSASFTMYIFLNKSLSLLYNLCFGCSGTSKDSRAGRNNQHRPAGQSTQQGHGPAPLDVSSFFKCCCYCYIWRTK